MSRPSWDARFTRRFPLLLAFGVTLLSIACQVLAEEVPCTGDCNGDNVVTVDELTSGVGIGLDLMGLDECRAFDADGSGAVTVDELVLAVGWALNRCPQTPLLTATPTATNTASLAPTVSATPTATRPGVTSYDFHVNLRIGPPMPGLFVNPMEVEGALRLEVGMTDADGVAQLRIPRDEAVLQPVPLGFLGLSHACLGIAQDGEGMIDCDGGSLGLDLSVQLDHNTTPANICLGGDSAGLACDGDEDCGAGRCNLGNGGPELGLPDDPDCTATATFGGETNAACREGDPCDARVPDHAAVCNSPLVITASEAFAEGDAQISFPIRTTVLRTGELGPDGLPCTADDTATDTNTVDLVFTTGAVSLSLYDLNNTAGRASSAGAAGNSFSCTALQNGGTLAAGIGLIDAGVSDQLITYVFELNSVESPEP